MTKAPATVLVPDTPTGAALQQQPGQGHGDHLLEESTIGESYLHDLIDHQGASPTIKTNTNTKRDFLTGSRSHKREEQNRVGNDELIDGTPSFGPEREVAQEMDVLTGRSSEGRSRNKSVSYSDPVEGPGGSGEVSACQGYLGAQTQGAQSLDTSWDKKRRLSDGELRKLQNRPMGETTEEPTTSEGETERKRAANEALGGEDDETDQLEWSDEVEQREEESERAIVAEGGGQRNEARESQKENASAPRVLLAARPSAPLGLRNSHTNLETASGPSSSPAVAQQLLARSPARRPPKATSKESATLSDPKPSPSEFESPRAPEAGDVSWEGDVSISASPRPFTSTPGVISAFPPAPAPTQALSTSRPRSVPNYQFVLNEASEPPFASPDSRPHPLRANTLPGGGGGGGGGVVPDLALFGSSAAMAKPITKGKKRKEEWDGISQDTPEEERVLKRGRGLNETPGTEGESLLSPTQVHDEEEDTRRNISRDGEGASTQEGERHEMPKPTAERTIDMEIDEGDSNPYLNGEGGTRDDSTVNGDINSPEVGRRSPPVENETDSSSAQAPPQNQARVPLFIDPITPASTSASSSPSISEVARSQFDSSAQEQPKTKRLSDISDVRSSQELPPTQFEVEATQKVYDAEKSQMSIHSIQMDVTDSWHAPFANDESTSRNHSRQHSNPIPGRELRRVVPPPTPVVELPSQRPSSPLKQSFRADDSFEPVNGSSPATVTPATNAAPLESSYAISASHDFVPEDSLALPIPPVQFFDSSRPSQATQQVAESSPEVPLAHLQQRASAASLQSNRRNPTPSPSRVASNGQSSSNGRIVPDSEGPTQPEQDEDEEEERPAELLRSPAVRRVRDENSDNESSTSLEGKTLEDMLAASSGVTDTKKARQAEEEVPKDKPVDRNGEGEVETVDTKGIEVVRKKSASREVRDPSQVESEVETKSKGKGKEKKKVAVEQKKKKSTGGKEPGKKAAKGKGKAKEVREEDSGEEASNDDNGEFEETNYSDAPRGKKNSKKMSPKKLQPVVVAPPRRKASRPSIVEQSDHEEAPEVVAPARRKRQASPAHEETKPTSKRAKASAPTKPVKAPPKKPSLSRSRKGEPPTSRASRSTEPEQPVAGPYRLRFADQEDTSTPRREESAAPSDSKPSTSTKLLPSAPFSRCFGLWRDDGYYYPGTITHVTSQRFHVKFDDTSGGKLRPDEVRRCELEKGDWVQYNGAEKLDTETREFRVLEVKRSVDAKGVVVELSGRDVIVAVEPADFGTGEARTHHLLVEAVRILRLRGIQFNNRRLTPGDLDAFEGRTRSNVKPLPLLPAPTRPPVSAFEDASSKWGVLGRTALLVTNASSKSSPNDPTAREFKQSDKERFVDTLKTAGATVIDWDHLFVARVDKETGEPIVTFPRADFTDIDTILLLSDRPTTTMKFLVALGLGIPCCSIEFADATIRENTRLDWEPYVLPSGYLDPLKFFGIGGQLRALRKSTHDIASLERAQRGDGIFAGQSFLVVTEKPGKSRDEKTAFNRQAYQILSLLACCSAARVDFLSFPFDASSKSFLSNPSEFVNSVSIYTHVFLDFEETNSKMESAVRPLINTHKGIVNMNWVKKCLVTGRLEPSERIRKVQDT